MMYLCRLTLGEKCTILVKNIGNGGGYAGVEAEGMWEISLYRPLIFIIKLNLLLK